jgi:hypothetical protein
MPEKFIAQDFGEFFFPTPRRRKPEAECTPSPFPLGAAVEIAVGRHNGRIGVVVVDRNRNYEDAQSAVNLDSIGVKLAENEDIEDGLAKMIGSVTKRPNRIKVTTIWGEENCFRLIDPDQPYFSSLERWQAEAGKPNPQPYPIEKVRMYDVVRVRTKDENDGRYGTVNGIDEQTGTVDLFLHEGESLMALTPSYKKGDYRIHRLEVPVQACTFVSGEDEVASALERPNAFRYPHYVNLNESSVAPEMRFGDIVRLSVAGEWNECVGEVDKINDDGEQVSIRVCVSTEDAHKRDVEFVSCWLDSHSGRQEHAHAFLEVPLAACIFVRRAPLTP